MVVEEKEIYVVWTNTDLTEGKGQQYPLHICLLEATAIRMAHKKGVMGSDAQVKKGVGYKINNNWFGPVSIVYPTKEDELKGKKMQDRQAAIDKAKAAGLSDDDIKDLVQRF